MKTHNITAILQKQIKDTIANPQILALYIIFPLVGFFMAKAVTGMEDFFVTIFATMHIVFTPLASAANLVSEEKEKNTLRALVLSGVHPLEYFAALVIFVLSSLVITSIPFLILKENFSSLYMLQFFVALLIGSFISVLIGSAVALHAKSSSSANGIAIALSMLFAFLPMLAYFNKSLLVFSNLLYGQQVSNLIAQKQFTAFHVSVLLANLLVFVFLYITIYKVYKKKENSIA